MLPPPRTCLHVPCSSADGEGSKGNNKAAIRLGDSAGDRGRKKEKEGGYRREGIIELPFAAAAAAAAAAARLTACDHRPFLPLSLFFLSVWGSRLGLPAARGQVSGIKKS